MSPAVKKLTCKANIVARGFGTLAQRLSPESQQPKQTTQSPLKQELIRYIFFIRKKSRILHFPFSDEKQNFKTHYQKTICELSDESLVLAKTQELDRQKDEMVQRHTEELKKFDTDLILQIDQKVSDVLASLEIIPTISASQKAL